MLEYLILFLSQIGVNVFKTQEILFTARHEVRKVLVNCIFLGLALLLSFYISIDSLFEGDYFILVVYLSGAVLGKHIALEFPLYKKFFRKISFGFLKNNTKS